jgi:hypothetical protein
MPPDLFAHPIPLLRALYPGSFWTPNAKGFTWTSLQADHSERMLREHYREVVSAEDAERYWEIRPV